MQNYFRITAYHPTENISVIMDSYGKFEKLWQFSSYIVNKGFKIIAVGGADKFDVGNIPKSKYDTDHIIICAYKFGKPIIKSKSIKILNMEYKILK